METEREINAKIASLTLQIQEKYFELTRFLTDMPITSPSDNNGETNVKKLKDFYESLKNVLESDITNCHRIKHTIDHEPMR